MDFLEAFDQGLLPWVQEQHTAALDGVMLAVTHLGDHLVALGMALVGALLLLAARNWRAAALLLVVALAAGLVTEGTKRLVGRPRPEVREPLTAIPRSPSFPSGHACNSAAVYVGFALLATARGRLARWRFPLVAAALALTFVIGVSRLYLGVHYFSDVVAGWAAGLAVALAAYWVAAGWGQAGKDLELADKMP